MVIPRSMGCGQGQSQATQTSPFCSLAPFPEKEKPSFDLAIPLTGEEQKLDAAYGEQRWGLSVVSISDWVSMAEGSGQTTVQFRWKGRGKSWDWWVTGPDWKGQQTVLPHSNKDVCSKPIDPLHAFVDTPANIIRISACFGVGALPAAPSLPHRASQSASTSLPASSFSASLLLSHPWSFDPSFKVQLTCLPYWEILSQLSLIMSFSFLWGA